MLATMIGESDWNRVVVIGPRAGLSRLALLADRCTEATIVRRAVPAENGAAQLTAAAAEAPR